MKSPEASAQPMVRFGDRWIPTHAAWRKMQTMSAAVRVIDRFNTVFPHLASPHTRDVVQRATARLKAIDLRMPGPDRPIDLGAAAAELLGSMSPEEVIGTLAQRHGVTLDLPQLIGLAGDEAYAGALAREAAELGRNGVSTEQTVQLWRDAERPAPGGGLWSRHKIEALLRAVSRGRRR